MTAPATEAPAAQRRALKRRTVLMLGGLLIPAALAIAFNSYGPLTVESALRMAFATIAGQTITILSAAAVVWMTFRRTRDVAPRVGIVLIAMFIVGLSLSTMATAGQLLLTRLDLINGG
ncbi:hypothetical protein GCM10027064_15210 [Microbacterium petrolearium]